MDKQKNNISLAFGVPGILIQLGGFCLSDVIGQAGSSPQIAGFMVGIRFWRKV